MEEGKEIRLEVVSEAEAIEYCTDNGYKFKGCETETIEGEERLILVAIDTSKTKEAGKHIGSEEEKEAGYIIYAITPTGRLYVADKNKCKQATTFHVNHAKLFGYKQAKDKAYFMSVNGTNSWEALKVKSR